MATKTEREKAKAKRRAANQALTARLRSLVAEGREDEATALVADRPASWAQIVTDAVRARDARAARKAEEAKAPKAKAPKAPKARQCGDGPRCVDPQCAGPGMLTDAPAYAPTSEAVDPLVAALAAISPDKRAAILAILTTGEDAPVAAVPVVTMVPAPDGKPQGLAARIGSRVTRVLTHGTSADVVNARDEARECEGWCEAAAQAADDAKEAARLRNLAAAYGRAVARLS